MTTNLSEHDLLQDLLLMENSMIDKGQQQLIERLRRHVRLLWRHVQRLEKVLAYTQDELELKLGDASLVMKKDGSIVIEGRNIKLKATGRFEIDGQVVDIKSTGPLNLRGRKIQEN